MKKQRLVKVRLSRRSYRKLLLVAKTSGYSSIQELMSATVEEIPLRVTTHSLYTCWINMKMRYLYPGDPSFKFYGGRKDQSSTDL
jgi:hypothetical protein